MEQIGFFQEDNGSKSITRLMFSIGIIWSILFTSVFSLLTKLGVGEIVALFGGTSGPFFALKIIQKTIEKNPCADKQGEIPPTT
jgi:hypothetical protein